MPCRWSSRRFWILGLLSLMLSSISRAQDALVMAPHKPIAPRVKTTMFDNEEATSRSIVGGPWMLDPNMKSTLYVRNNIETKRY